MVEPITKEVWWQAQRNLANITAEFDLLKVGIGQLEDDVSQLQTDLDQLRLEMEHDSDIFPDSTARIIELTAGTPADTWSDWVEVEDDTPVTPVTFTSKIVKETHVTGILIEDLSDSDKRYELEIAWGDDKTRFLRHRFLSGEVKKLAAIQFMRIRAESIPVGEKVYYRMRCQEALATCEISLRYHYHPE